MSILGQRVSPKLIAAMAALMLLVALLPALSATPTRQVTLVAKDMAFYLEEDLKTANPTIDVKAGERLRIVVRNQDRGLTHDLAVPLARVVMKELTWDHSGRVAFTVPKKPGTYEYFCQPHRLMMHGILRVN